MLALSCILANLRPHDGYFARRLDADTHGLPLHAEDRDRDIVSDLNLLLYLPRQHEHGKLLCLVEASVPLFEKLLKQRPCQMISHWIEARATRPRHANCVKKVGPRQVRAVYTSLQRAYKTREPTPQETAAQLSQVT